MEKVINGLTSFDEVLRVIEVDSDFGEDEQDIKDAIMGKSPIISNQINNEKIETLDF